VADAFRRCGFDVTAVPATPPPTEDLLSGAWDERFGADRPSTAASWPRDGGPAVLAGRSPALRKTLEAALRAAGGDDGVVLVGERGAGHEAVAREIHEHSHRAALPFCSVAVAGRDELAVDRDLFGFGGAMASSRGGTVFLSGLGGASSVLQERLAKAAVAAGAPRLIASALRGPRAPGASLDFHAEIARRLPLEIAVPPLRERREDLPALVERTAHACAGEAGKPAPAFGSEAMRALMEYDWPGNFAQLRNAVERIVWLGRAEIVDVVDLPVEIFYPGAENNPPWPLRTARKAFERQHILWAIREHGGDKPKAAEALGINLSSLYRKLTGEDSEDTRTQYSR
jgi:two-component system nitrogen regulation response regulator NtrX